MGWGGRQHSCTISVLYKMRYVSFLLVHIHGNSAKPITTTTSSKLRLYSIYLSITFTRQTGNNRDTEHTIGPTGSPAGGGGTRQQKYGKRAHVWRVFQSHKLRNTFNIKPNSFVWIQLLLFFFFFFNSTGMSPFHFRLK